MRLAVLVVGVLLMAGAALFGLWPLVLIAAILTALVLIRFYEFYRSIPFLLALLGFLSFFLAGSAGSPSSSFNVLRGILFAGTSLGISLVSAIACAEVLVFCRGGNRRAALNIMLGIEPHKVIPGKVS